MDCNVFKKQWTGQKYLLAALGVGGGMVYPDAWYVDPQDAVTAQNPNPAPIKVGSVMAGEYSGTRLTQADILEKIRANLGDYGHPIPDALKTISEKAAPSLTTLETILEGIRANLCEAGHPIPDALTSLANEMKTLDFTDPVANDLLKHVVATLSDGKVHAKEFYTAPTGTEVKAVDSVFRKKGIDLGTGLNDYSVADMVSDGTYTHILPMPATPFLTTAQLTANKLENIDRALRTIVAQISEHGVLSAKLPEGAHYTVPGGIPFIGGQPIRDMDGNLIPYNWTYDTITKEPNSTIAPYIPVVGGFPDYTGVLAPPQVKPTSTFLYKRFKEGATDETLASILVESLRAGVIEPNSLGKLFAVGGSYGRGLADMLATGENITESGWLNNIFGNTAKPEGLGELLTRALTLKNDGKDSISLIKAFFHDDNGTPKSLATIEEQMRVILEKLKLIGDKDNILETVQAIVDSAKLGRDFSVPLTELLTEQLGDVPEGLIDLLIEAAIEIIPEGTSIGSTPVVVQNNQTFNPTLELTDDAIQLNITNNIPPLAPPVVTVPTADIVAQLTAIANKPAMSTAGIEAQLQAIAEKAAGEVTVIVPSQPGGIGNLDKLEASIKMVAEAIAACCCNEAAPPVPPSNEPRYPQPTAPYEGEPEPGNPTIPIIEPDPPPGYGERRTDDDLCKAITYGVHLILDFLSSFLNIMDWANSFFGREGMKRLIAYLSGLKWVRAFVAFFVVIDSGTPFSEIVVGGILVSTLIEWIASVLLDLTIEGLELLVDWFKQNEKKIICILYNATDTNKAVQQVLDLLENDSSFNSVFKGAAKGALNVMLYNPVIYGMYFRNEVSLDGVIADCSGCKCISFINWPANEAYTTEPIGQLKADGQPYTLTSGVNGGTVPHTLAFSTNCENCNPMDVQIIGIATAGVAKGGEVKGCDDINQCRYNRGLVSDNEIGTVDPNGHPVTNFYGTFTDVKHVVIQCTAQFTVTVIISEGNAPASP